MVMSRRAWRAVVYSVLLAFPHFAFSGPAPEAMRDVRVKIVADEEWRRDPGWESKARGLIQGISAEFERLFAIRLIPERFGDWESNDAVGSIEVLADDLESRVEKEGCDILIALTAQANLSRGLLGCSLFREGLILVRALDNDAVFARVLKHELGHLFGAVHVSDPGSIMDVFIQGDVFDDLSREAIRLVRGRLFNTIEFPIPGPVRVQAIGLYSRICAALASAEAQKKLGWAEATGVRAVVGESGRRETRQLDDASLFLAEILVEEKRYDEAASSCQSGLKINPGDLDAQNILGIIDRKQGRIDEAIQKYQAILKADPRHPRVHYNLGIAYFKKGDFEAARAAYEKAIALKPRSAEAHNNLGETLLRLEKPSEAERELSLAASLDPQYALALANLADLALKQGDFPKTRALLERAMKANPEVPSVWNALGNLAAREGRLEEAVRDYQKALSIDPDYEKGYFNLGICLFGQNQVNAARDNFVRAVSLNPNFAEAHASLGYCLMRENKVDEAISEILLARKLGFRSAITHLNLSFAYIVKKRLDEAIDEARQAIALDPRLPMAYNNLGIAYTKKGMLAEAEGQFELAIKADRRCREAWLNLGNLHYMTGKSDLALQDLVEAARLGSKDGALLNNIAVLCYKKGDYRLALEYAEKAVAAGFAVDAEFLAGIRKKLSGRDGI
jgi:tetratricopeptide (TPR) repeat protein